MDLVAIGLMRATLRLVRGLAVTAAILGAVILLPAILVAEYIWKED